MRKVTLANNDAKPLRITPVHSESPRFTVRIETLEEGRQYRLVVQLNPDAPVGRFKDLLEVFTDNQRMPRLAIPVHLFIRNEVYANPDRIDFGTISLAQLEKSPDLLPYLTQTILIKRRQGEDFQIKVQSDLPFLQIVKTPDLGSTIYRLDISLVIEKLSRGKITGSIRILTNDRDFPELVIPVQGEVKMGENSVRYLNFQYKDITIYGVQTTTG